jgi:DeoR/GlpR family transcriptional regulator of sugar metabolism
LAEYRIPAERLLSIQRLAEERGIISVAELSSLLEVSEITIRRDLAVLERRGVLERARGGAICTHRMRVEALFSQKGQENKAQKEAIGRAAADLVEDGDTVLVSMGSTTLEVIRCLEARKVQVITNNIAAALDSKAPAGELILIGGSYRSQSGSAVGGFATGMLQQVYGSKTIIGCDGFSVGNGLTISTAQEAEVTRCMIGRTRGRVIVVADHRKLAVVANFVAAALDAVDVLITDAGAPQRYLKEIEQAGVKVMVAPMGPA